MKKTSLFLAIMLILCFSISLGAQATTYKTNQDCTAYCWTGDRMANGQWPSIGYVAVHPTTYLGATPVIPFGKILYVDSCQSDLQALDYVVYAPDGEYTSFCVGDLGDTDFDLNRTKYFLDLYFGTDTTYANNWGVGTIAYHYN